MSGGATAAPSAGGAGTLGRLLRTPLLELLRGRTVNGRELTALIEDFGLPAPLGEAVRAVTLKTRLRPSEQLDVARELLAHFRDGLAAGQEPQQLVAKFGDIVNTAALIRRARLRGRSFAARTASLTKKAMVATTVLLLVAYAILFTRFHLAAESPGTTPSYVPAFVASVNASVRTLPPDARAWTKYQRAYDATLAMLREWPGRPEDERPESLLWQTSETERWDSLVSFLGNVRATVRDVQEAAAIKDLGFELRLNQEQPWIWIDCSRPTAVFQLLPQLLHADLLRALANQDADTVSRNVVALFGMAKHSRETAPSALLISLSFTPLQRGITLLNDILQRQPELLSGAQLDKLAGALRSLGGAEEFRFRTEMDRETARRAWGRLYRATTPNGSRVTKQGLEHLRRVSRSKSPTLQATLNSPLASPVLPFLILSREELDAKVCKLFDALEAQLRRPLWERDQQLPRLGREENQSPLDLLRNLPFRYHTPWVGLRGDQVALMRRDAALVGIALEQYRRQTGRWPATLDELTPELIPQVPKDRYDGQALRYVRKSGKPILYSVGRDAKDDQGRPRAGPCARESSDMVLWKS